jgi:hypothetical protein
MPSPPESRFLALRHAGQDASDFSLSDDQVRRFMELRDAGADPAAIGSALGARPEVVEALVAADEQQAIAHRIAAGQEPMYPLPEPEQRVVDTRFGSSTVPLIVIAAVAIAIIVYLAVGR